ncbi:hypothetical protein SD71_21190 [Cohnella kolymensis]|uniref:Uncharacterized protein n=1 Tax=Cohnella kolymensis TaxID=1590652 RepID=A0ABR4ZZE2_9BACL|nr:hypothetical protein [Cohnella kolymensis]KIL34184.1 hypothetical protein SD71_21190 [Cohnella kolymensis]
MKIELNKKQYRDLIELLFLGNWVANASRTGAEGDEMLEQYEEIYDYILSHATTFEADDVVQQEGKQFYTTMDFDESIMPIVEDYDDYTFWEQLSLKLAERDLLRELGPVSFNEAHRERMYEIAEEYEIEFEKNGLKNLTLMKPEKKK